MKKSLERVLVSVSWWVSTAVLAAVGAVGTFLALAWLGALLHGTYEVAWPVAAWLVPLALTASAPTVAVALYLGQRGGAAAPA